MGVHVVWFERDLRVHDHEPFVRAAAAKRACAVHGSRKGPASRGERTRRKAGEDLPIFEDAWRRSSTAPGKAAS